MARGSKVSDHLTSELTNPEFAATYLAIAISEGDEKFLSRSLAKVIKAHGISKVAGETGLARQALYKMLSIGGNPSFKNISKLLNSVGLELTVKSKKKAS